MRVIGTSRRELAEAADTLRSGGLVAIPTETVYGLAGNAWDPKALARIFEAKNRPQFDPLIVHVANPEGADEVADMSTPHARALARSLWPGPLTMVLPRRPGVPDLATSGLSTVGVRCPAHPVARLVIELAGVPAAAPSANPFGYLSPTRAEHVAAQLGERVDLIVDGGPCPIGVESTVLDLSASPPLVLRPGAVSMEELMRLVPGVELFDRATSSPRAPGQLPSHYAPRAPLRLLARGGLVDAKPGARAAALCFGRASADRIRDGGRFGRVVDLSPAMDPREAACALFSALHELDAEAWPELWAERLPDDGIGRAVNDRLYKASVKD